MTCEQIGSVVSDYVSGDLDVFEESLVEVHVEQCVSCRQAIDLWRKLELLPQEQPSSDLRFRFEARLASTRDSDSKSALLVAGLKKDVWFPVMHGARFHLSVPSVALALVLLVIGFVAGKYGDVNSKHESEIADLRSELTSVHQSLALTLMREESASDRLRGVTLSVREQHPDLTVLTALLYTLRHDSSVDVRLASLDAVSRYESEQLVQDGLVEALKVRQSPLVQIGLIELMVDLRQTSVLPTLRGLARDTSVNEAVRERAAWAIRRLS